MQISKYIDHTILKATTTENDILQLCNEAIAYNFYSVCVNSSYVKLCVTTLQNSNIKIAAVVGFPLGAMDTNSKIFEAKEAVKNGADEIDMVINIGFLKDKKYTLVENEIRLIKEAIGNTVLKVIIETCYLTVDEKKTATQLIMNAGADFVKTSTGFGTGGATLHDIDLLKSITNNLLKIKASGGIKDYTTAIKFIEHGANRIGTSNGIQIVTQRTNSSTDY